MNLLPAVEAYIDERQRQLRALPSPPIQTMRELQVIENLCRALGEQSEMMDKMLAPILAEPKPEEWPCCVCNGAHEHYAFCALHPCNLTKL